MADSATPDLLTLTAQITAAYVAGNTVGAVSVPELIRDVYRTLASAGAPEPVQQEPAVPVKRSVQHDHLVCLEDGAKVKVLTKYIKRFGLTPSAYRAKWGLPQDYPMVAPAHSARRATIAKAAGLGRRPATPLPPTEAPESVPAWEEMAETQHTAASVFANFPAPEVPTGDAAAPPTPVGTIRPTRKRFGQQLMRSGGRKPR